MNCPHNIKPLIQAEQGFWEKHPWLRGFGVRFLPWLIAIMASCTTVLAYIETKVTTNIAPVLMIVGVVVVIFLSVVVVTYILDQRKRIKELEEDISHKDREIAFRDKEITLGYIMIDFLKNLLHPEKRNDFNQIYKITRLIDPEDPEDMEFLMKALWKIKNQNSSED